MYTIGVVLGALSAGVICGLGPLILGSLNNKFGLGVGGFIACLIGGFVAGIKLAGPICIIFSLIIKLIADKTNKKQCPFCGKKILIEAKVCKHCKRELI